MRLFRTLIMNTYSLKNLSDLSRLDEQMIVLWNKKYGYTNLVGSKS